MTPNTCTFVHEHSLSRLGTGTKIRSGGVKVVYWTTVSFLSEMMLHLYKLISITRRPLEIRNIRVKTNQVICTNKREKNGYLYVSYKTHF